MRSPPLHLRPRDVSAIVNYVILTKRASTMIAGPVDSHVSVQLSTGTIEAVIIIVEVQQMFEHNESGLSLLSIGKGTFVIGSSLMCLKSDRIT